MKTKISEEIHKKIYLIEGEDENGLIPIEARSAIVSYSYEDKAPNGIYFIDRANEGQINPIVNRRDDIIQMVNALEAALE